MPVLTPSNALKSTILNDIKNAIDSGGDGGSFQLYTGAKPAGPDTAVGTQVLLGTMALSYPCGAVSAGSLVFGPITQDSSADNSGIATWGRFLSSSGVAVLDVDVSTIGGSGFVQMNTVNVVALGPILVNSCVISA